MNISIQKVRKTILSEFLKSFACFDGKEPFNISLVGITYPDAAYRITRSKSDLTVVEYVLDGEGYVILDGKTLRVGRDTVYLLSQGEKHDYYSDKKNPFTKIFLNATGSLAERLVMEYGLSGKHLFSACGLKPVFERTIATVKSDLTEWDMQSALQGIFTEIVCKLSFSISDTAHSEEALALKKHIDLNHERIVSAKELARVVFRSKDYCQKLFLKEFGVTPYAYQLDRKIQTAKALLAQTQLSIGEIAARLGYSDPHYFSNVFFKKCGCRPTDYKRNRG